MKIGISTSCFYPLETEKSLLEVCKSNADCTEIFFNADCELENGFVKELKQIKDCYGTKILSIHPTMSLAESFRLFSAYDRRKIEGLDFFRRYGEICGILGAEYVILHGGKPNGILDDDEYCERFVEIGEAVAENGGILLQENVAKYRAGNIDFLKFIKQKLKNDARFCLDIKQCIRGGYSPFDAIKILGDSIKHIHISDNNQEKDCLLPGNGTFDYSAFFKELKQIDYKNNAVIEVYRDAYKDYGDIFSSYDYLEKLRCQIL